jgi:hypothetical protein
MVTSLQVEQLPRTRYYKVSVEVGEIAMEVAFLTDEWDNPAFRRDLMQLAFQRLEKLLEEKLEEEEK